jgi:pimeloyl-ACP methyl ester carboxylesterase
MTPFHPTQPKLRRAYAEWAHGQIHYYDGGGAGIPLLLLHQSPASSSDWFSIIPFLTEAGIRVLAMDTPGMGLSDPLPFEPVIADYADAVPVVLDNAGVESAHLLGHHTGAQIAVEAAVRHAARVRSAALYGVPVMSPDEREDYWRRIVPREQEGAIHHPAPGGSNLTEHVQRIETMFGNVAAQRLLLSGLIAGPLWWHGHNAALRHDMVPGLLAAQQKLLLLSHPSEMLDANTQEALRLRPDASYVCLPTQGQIAMDDGPSALAEAVIAFVRSVG